MVLWSKEAVASRKRQKERKRVYKRAAQANIHVLRAMGQRMHG